MHGDEEELKCTVPKGAWGCTFIGRYCCSACFLVFAEQYSLRHEISDIRHRHVGGSHTSGGGGGSAAIADATAAAQKEVVKQSFNAWW